MVRPSGGLTYGRRARRTIGGVSAWHAPEGASAAARSHHHRRASSGSSSASSSAATLSDSDSEVAAPDERVQVIVYTSPRKSHAPLKAKPALAQHAAAPTPATRTSPRKPLGERRTQEAASASTSSAAASSRLPSALAASSSAQRSAASSSRLQTSVRATPSSSVYFSAASLPSSSPARSAAGRQTEKRAKRSAAGEAQRRIVQLRHAEEEAAIKSPRRASPVKSSALQRWDDDEELVRRMGGASLSSELSSPPPSSCPLAPSSPFAGPSAKLKEPSSTLSDLLRLCGQPRAADFSTLVSTLARPARGRGRPKTTADPRWRKVGEASYSEVFARGDKVVKIVPLRLASAAAAAAHAAEHDAEWPEESSVQDVGREIEIMRALHGIEGFVELESAHIATGPYAPALLSAWDEYASSKAGGSENVRPSVLPPTAHYALLLLSHAGQDLEGVRLPNWRAAAAVFWQVVGALGRAERAREFEHRDLHWGNVLVSFSEPSSPHNETTEPERTAASFVASLRSAEKSGVRATIIDVSLSRLLEPAADPPLVLAYDFADESIFTGEGDAQFDVYRAMRTLTQGRWEAWHPRTNVLWLHYLLDKLLHAKGLRRPPGARSAPATMSALARFRQAAQTDDDERAAYESLAAAAAQLARSLDAGGCGSARELLVWAC